MTKSKRRDTRPPMGSQALPPLSFEEVITVIDGAWMRRGNCAQSGIDMTSDQDKSHLEAKRAVCDGCPVADSCLRYMLLTNDQYTIAAGMGYRARRAFDNGQRYSVCERCSAGFTYSKTNVYQRRNLCASCSEHPVRDGQASRQHFTLENEMRISS